VFFSNKKCDVKIIQLLILKVNTPNKARRFYTSNRDKKHLSNDKPLVKHYFKKRRKPINE